MLVFMNILNDTDIVLHPGETECFSTKETMLANELTFSSSSSRNVGGRKIDVLVKTGAGKEICAIEFKRSSEKKQKTSRAGSSSRSTLSLCQESKSMRINKCILNQMKKAGCKINKIMGLDFNGLSGYVYALLPYQKMYVAILVREIDLPSNQSELQQDKLLNALLAFFELKEFWLSLEEDKQEDNEEEEEEEEDNGNEEEEREDNDDEEEKKDDEKDDEEEEEKNNSTQDDDEEFKVVIDKTVFFTPKLASKKLQ
ncbi:hypothetical protein EDC96DRAFT_104178 [Choanephora cucurbitarum]|nr:hypothetical protein EDC96DRAFT_104178 [Choanephora cucurbitarum]